MIVVKLGGSLYNTPELKLWLETLAEQAKYQAIIIVPGGGPFADQVRHAQTLYNFSDSHAHHMALLAMAQYGLLLSDIEPTCQTLYFPNTPPPSRKGIWVWLPNEKFLAVEILKHNWDITSDSLALWLANALDAEQLILIKQTNAYNNTSIEQLEKQGVIDKEFPKLYSDTPVPSRIILAGNYQQFSELLHNNFSSESLLT